MKLIVRFSVAILAVVVLLGIFMVGRLEISSAQRSLVTFFSHLSSGRYADATRLFGGSYDILISDNPEISPFDFTALFRNGCEINGFQCLPIRQANFVREDPPDQFIFDVEFTKADGSQFVQGPCCGADVISNPPTSIFTFHVAKGEDGKYRVLDLPVYVP